MGLSMDTSIQFIFVQFGDISTIVGKFIASSFDRRAVV
mgnify:CR=1 FL=1